MYNSYKLGGTVGTNTSDPNSIHSRVFVGNLNTFKLTKDEVESVFKHYGIISGMSMHKGYAFIQYTREGDARRAVANEDGRMYAGQALDINMAAEPKDRSGGKRQYGISVFDWQPPVDPYVQVHRAPPTPPAKRMRLDSEGRNLMTVGRAGYPVPSAGVFRESRLKAASKGTSKSQARTTSLSASSGKQGSAANQSQSSDILICGVCKQQFKSVQQMTQHKKTRCRLSFSCLCGGDPTKSGPGEPIIFTCATCDGVFGSAFSLCQHCQNEHVLQIFKLDAPTNAKDENNHEVITIT